MKTRNKLLTLLILAAGDAAATACINKAIKLSAISRHIFEMKAAPLMLSLGALETFTIQRRQW
ncbi:MAG: hypothetical protein ACLVG5_03790 [Clostridium sp.]